MSYRADPLFLVELQKYGDVNIEACFNCGNCTAVCPLSSGEESFPRRMIRYAQIGTKDRLLGSKELWMCYYCGECSATCPRQANPGEFMAAARRYAIARYDPLGLAKVFFTSPLLSALFLVVFAVGCAMFMYTNRGPMSLESMRLFDFIPARVIHDLGLTVMAVAFLTGLWGAVNMVLHIGRVGGLPGRGHLNWFEALWEAIGLEVLSQRRYRRDCETYTERQPWYLRKWFIHASMMWGFLGLLAATALDYALDVLGLKATGTWVPIWDPIRLLGTVAGIFLVYGSSVAIANRLLKTDGASTYSTPSDWIFLVLLWLSGASGFVLEISLYLPEPQAWGYWILLFHVAASMELVLLVPFTKFAHAVYRTIALYAYSLKPLPGTELTSTGSAD
jgi:ferredoxin